MQEYDELKINLAKGWNTWNVKSVLSHVLLPHGFALNLGIKEYKDGEYLREALVGRHGENAEIIHPGAHAYDGSYTELNLKWKGIEAIIQSTVIDEEIVILVTPVSNQLKPSALVIESGFLWNREGYALLKEGVLSGVCSEQTIEIHTTEVAIYDPHIPSLTSYIALSMDRVIGISSGKKRNVDEIKAIIATKKDEIFKKTEQYGELAEVYHAMQTCLAWDTIYEPAKDRVISPVNRIWCGNGYVLFCWDTYFAAYMALLDNKELAYSNVIEMTKEKTNKGFIPNTATHTGFKTLDRSQPPVGSMVVKELYRKFQDKWLLEELFDDLYDWNSWFFHNRRINDDLMAWGSSPYPAVTGNHWEIEGVNQRYGAALESGLDNSPMYDDIAYNPDNHCMELADVGLMGLYIMDCRALADIAKVLGRIGEAAELDKRIAQITDGLNTLWLEEKGMFMNRRTDNGEFSLRLSPTNFYALYSDAVEINKAERMISEHFYNPEEFFGEWIIPSIARNDMAYLEQDYWRGRIWAPMNFLVYLAFRRHNFIKPCKDIAEKSKKLLLKEWLEHGHVHENYCAETGEGCNKVNSDKFYHWGGLLSVIALMDAGFIAGPENSIASSD